MPPSRHSDQKARRLRVLAEVRAVPAGQISSYGVIARRAGFPGAARWVARVLADNEDADLPWHRILRSDGRIAFAPGSAEFDEQCARLRAEGVEVRGGRVRITLEDAQWLDQILWGDPEKFRRG